jgi:peptide/nickel transport system substrate-binding protein
MSFSGPKARDLYYVITRDMDAALLSMSSGKIDVLSDIYRPVDVERLEASGSVNLSVASSYHGFFVTFNLRRFPWDQKELRQAAAMVIDRRRWVRDLFAGYCEPLLSFLPPVSNYSTRGGLPRFDAEEAKKLLSGAGWTWNRSGWLVAPDGRELPNTRILCPPSSVAATSTEIAELAAEAFRSIGIPAEAEPMDFQTLLSKVDIGDFDACTNAWSMSLDPDVLYSFYHSSMNVEGGSNQSGIGDPELDKALFDLRYAPDERSARDASERAQALLAELMPVIPIYSRYSISAASKAWDGIFSTDTSTSDNLLTLISMTPSDGSERPIYWNIPEEIRTLNPLVSSTAYDWTVLGTIYDTPLSTDPYTKEDIPWLAETWSITREGSGTALAFTFRKGLKWQDGYPLSAHDFAYTLQFIKDNLVPRFYDNVKDIDKIEVSPDGLTVKVYMKNTSYWHLHNIGGMIILPKHIMENVPDWRTWQPSNRPRTAADGTELTELIGTGPFVFRESRTGEYVHMTRSEHYFLNREAGQ